VSAFGQDRALVEGRTRVSRLMCLRWDRARSRRQRRAAVFLRQPARARVEARGRSIFEL